MKKIGVLVAGAAGSIAVFTLPLCLAGFVRTWAQNGALGDIASGEVYSIANTVPNVLFEIAAGGAFVGVAILPASGLPTKGMKDELERTASALAIRILAVGLPIVGAVALAVEPITRVLLGAHKSPEELALAATFLRAFTLQVPLYGLSVVLTGILRAHKRSFLPALVPMLSPVAVIAVLAVFAQVANGKRDSPGALTEATVAWLGWGTTMGVVAFVLSRIVLVARIVKLRPTFRFPDGVAGRARGLIGAGPGGLLAQQVQIVTIIVVVNGFGDTGAYSVCIFANAVYMVPYAALATPIVTAAFPRLSGAAALPGGPGLTSPTVCPTRLVLDVGTVIVALLAVLASSVGPVFEVLRLARGMDAAIPAMAPDLAGYAFIYHGSCVFYAVEASHAVVLVNLPAWLSVYAALGASVATGIDGRRQTLIAVGASVSAGTTIGAIDQIAAIRRVIEKWATVDMTCSVLIVGAVLAIGAVLGHMTVRLVLGVLGADSIGAFVSAAVGGVVVLSAGKDAVLLFNRDVLRLARGAKEPGVEGSRAERPDVEGPTSDGAGTQ